jgi:predicted nucleotidyltransferase
VDAAVRAWARVQAAVHPDILRLGYFGSYARGDWGVGSDLDLVAVVKDSSLPFEQRALAWNLEDLPVPAGLLVYTEAEWQALHAEGGRFARSLTRETVWLFG